MPKSTEQTNNKKTVIIAAVIVAIVLAGLVYFGWKHSLDKATREAADAVPQHSQEPLATSDAQTLTPLSETAESTPPASPAAAHEAGSAAPTSATGADPCKEATDKIVAFFRHLDRQEYIKNYGLKETCENHFAKIAKKLYAKPPVVTRETDDLFTILTNSAHFYRILGRQDLLLIKDILKHETDTLEEVMAVFYHWSEKEQACKAANFSLPLPLNSLYEYSGFFLNTLGGQSYLFRRDSRTRILIKYYAVTILDRANDKGLNRHGIDIRTPLRSAIEEMEVSHNIKNREAYLKRLTAMQTKYQKKYGNK